MEITILKKVICRSSRQRPRRAHITILVLILVLLAAGKAIANPAQGAATANMPTGNGCLSCHANPGILSVPGARHGLLIDQGILGGSIHRTVPCTGCHIDFNPLTASQYHGRVTSEFRTIAGLSSCVSCHKQVEQLEHYSKSAHGRAVLEGTGTPAVKCTDCHGSHNVGSFKKDENFRKAYQMAAIEICGRCHQDHADSYNDYYHGLAYKAKAEEAPACWDCHSAHGIFGADEAVSSISKTRIASICDKCHEDARAEYANQYRKLIHGRQKLLESNFLGSYATKLVSLVASALERVGAHYNAFVSSLLY